MTSCQDHGSRYCLWGKTGIKIASLLFISEHAHCRQHRLPVKQPAPRMDTMVLESASFRLWLNIKDSLLSPILVGAAIGLSSVMVLGNALRLRKVKV
jgi:hypothetical protein